MAQYPFVKIFFGSDRLVHFMTYTDERRCGQYAENYIGQGLIDFIELDLTDFVALLTKAKAVPKGMENYQTIRNLIFDVAETLLGKHRYAFFFLVGLLNNVFKTPIYIGADIVAEQLGQLSVCLEELERVLELQEVFREGVLLCLDKENRPDRMMSERLCDFVTHHPAFCEAAVKIRYELLPGEKGKVDVDTLRDIHDWGLTSREELLEIMHQDGEGVSLMPYYLVEFLDEMLFFEFTEMLKNGQYVKRCKLCGRYFVLTDKRRREFCDRPYQGNRTCKKVGPKVFFDKEVGDDDYLKKYLAEYNKVYSRRYRADGKYARELSGKDMTREQFEAWRRLASQARREYVEQKISGEELLARIRLE